MSEEAFVQSSGKYCEWGWLADADSSPFVAAKLPVGTTSRMAKIVKLDLKAPAIVIGSRGKEIGVILCLLRIEGCPRVLVAPVNHFCSVHPNPLLTIMRTQELRVYFYEDKAEPCRRDVFKVDISAGESIIAEIAALPPWSDDAFLDALDSINESPEELWRMYP